MNTTFKFGLTLAATLVLAACGSSGGNNGNNTAAPAPAPTPAPTVTPAPAPTPVPDVPALVEDSAVEYGGKFAKKQKSNLNVGSEGESDSSGSATAMTVKLEPNLDTIVVASEVDINGRPKAGSDLIYLEDFDFRVQTPTNTTGTHTLDHIHVYNSAVGKGATFDPNAALGVGANVNTDPVGRTMGVQPAITKTPFKGQDQGTVLVYNENAPANTGYYVNRAEVQTAAGVAHVAEVYGHRTFVYGNSETGENAPSAGASTATGEANLNNAPYLNNKGTEGGRLRNVQYGRVTSALDKLTQEQLRLGVDVGTHLKTRIASYGVHGTDGTENSYFYRGVNPTAEVMKKTGADLVTALKETYASGKINYQGHAVTYGFKHEYTPPAVAPTTPGGVPNAIAGTSASVAPSAYTAKSGTHVAATVDLSNYNVNGRLWDVYTNGTNDQNVVLARFNGTLTTHGNVVGTSTREADNAEGTLRATLYGVQASELGGAIASQDRSDSWGAVFGAKQTLEAGLGIGTDSNNRNQ